MKDKKLPKLRVNKAEASEKIRSRIDAGKELYKVQISSEQELADIRHARERWVDYNSYYLIPYLRTHLYLSLTDIVAE